jgi:hypothetical protein
MQQQEGVHSLTHSLTGLIHSSKYLPRKSSVAMNCAAGYKIASVADHKSMDRVIKHTHNIEDSTLTCLVDHVKLFQQS